MTWTIWIVLGSLSGGLGVALGAFAAHALKVRLTPEDLAIFDVGARYQMYHAFALLACGFMALRIDSTAVRIAGSAFVVGTILFSGSLYVLTLSGQRWLGMVTPLGGLSFIIGWISLAWAAARPGS